MEAVHVYTLCTSTHMFMCPLTHIHIHWGRVQVLFLIGVHSEKGQLLRQENPPTRKVSGLAYLLHDHCSQVPEYFIQVRNRLHNLADLPLPLLHHQRVLLHQHQLLSCETLAKQEYRVFMSDFSPCENATVHRFRHDRKKI